MEELVAELGSCFLSADLDIAPEIPEENAAYIASLLKKVLKEDSHAIFNAAAHASRAAEYLHPAPARRARP